MIPNKDATLEFDLFSFLGMDNNYSESSENYVDCVPEYLLSTRIESLIKRISIANIGCSNRFIAVLGATHPIEFLNTLK